jgi:hypothetical protein
VLDAELQEHGVHMFQEDDMMNWGKLDVTYAAVDASNG